MAASKYNLIVSLIDCFEHPKFGVVLKIHIQTELLNESGETFYVSKPDIIHMKHRIPAAEVPAFVEKLRRDLRGDDNVL